MGNALAYSILGATLFAAAPLVAGKVSPTTQDTDRIDVIAHIPLSGGPVVQLISGSHWRRDYLYLDQGSKNSISIFDVTNPAAPKLAGSLDLAGPQANGTVNAVVGNAVMVASSTPVPVKQTVTLMNVADPEHPKVTQQFSGVTSILKDTSRSLVYLTNPDGLWVLRLDPATDVQMQKEYNDWIRYYR